MTFPHISRTFMSGETIHLERKMSKKETTKEMLRNLNINVISEGEIGGENLSGICPYVPRSVLNNCTTEEIHVVFRANSESSNINDMSDAATDSESFFEQDMCMKDSQDFEDDRDCNLSPDLLRMVEEDEKQILAYKELVEIMSLGDKKEVKIGADITVETKRDLIELLQEFKDVFTWSYQYMLGLSTDIVVHRLPIKEECKPV
ncbi:L-type lectin-domain containing receptor kinase IX.1-like [Gossypium australe]|uniref:L-type lectin-domain containing receptor kinase IX.1-like n=1 Tax=Gossypium australe TaxID=47621 RepID=A0A5B6V0K4_9ROSI|nr:L-type lectin-domain containing receptor kinase IX.1-like [Gossypium australe]